MRNPCRMWQDLVRFLEISILTRSGATDTTGTTYERLRRAGHTEGERDKLRQLCGKRLIVIRLTHYRYEVLCYKEVKRSITQRCLPRTAEANHRFKGFSIVAVQRAYGQRDCSSSCKLPARLYISCTFLFSQMISRSAPTTS